MVNEIINLHQQKFIEKFPHKKTSKNEMKRFWYFICERQKIWHKRYILNKEQPWTKDRVLIDTKFTNVYRDLDRGTLYYLLKIKPIKNKKQLLFNTIIYRIFNFYPTFEKIGIQSVKNFKPKKLLNRLNKIEKTGRNIFTNAHMVTGGGNSFKGFKKHETAMFCINELHKNFDKIYNKIVNSKKMEEVFLILKDNIGMVGPFLSYEIVIDLIYSGFLPFTEDDWVNIGPGCGRGIDIIFPNKRLYKNKTEQLIYLRKNQRKFFKQYGLKFPFLKINGIEKELTLRSIEHSLCEFQKYFKAWHGEGKKRMKFVPTLSNEENFDLRKAYEELGFL